MQIHGHGIDIIELRRVESLIKEDGDNFLHGWFTQAEVLGAPAANTTAYYAGRLAAKEAVAKAIGTGLVGQMSWTEIEIYSAESGQPQVHLTGSVLEVTHSYGIETLFLTISHSAEWAVASVIAVGRS